MLTEVQILENLHLEWFVDSPNPGDPACTCSLCRKPISEDDVIVRAWEWWPAPEEPATIIEARFHIECYWVVLRQADNNCRGYT